MAAVELDFAAGSGWHGALALTLRHTNGRTVVAERRHEGPFCLQRPFHPGDGTCHVYLLHPPGGLAGGDRLVLDAHAEHDAAVLLTTPAATKFYRSDGAPSVQSQTLRAAAGASLEWLPQDTILFGGSRARIATAVQLDRRARYIGWELTSLGRPLSRDAYASGALEQRTRIEIDGTPRLIERLAFAAGDALLAAPWGLAGNTVFGTLHAYPAGTAELDAARTVLGDGPTCGATLLEDLLVVRWLGTRPETARTVFETLWTALRAAVTGHAPCTPRIWRT